MDTLKNHSNSNLHIVITGGGRGIGAAIADMLDTPETKMTLMGRSNETLQSKCGELSNAQGITVDVCDEQSVIRAFDRARDNFGPVNILINNAGAAHGALLHRTETEQWRHMLDVNLSGVFYCCKEVVADMLESDWGRIINIASIAGLAGAPYISAYCAAKHGVIGLTRALALEVARKNITVNAVCPGYTRTDLLEEAISNIMSKTTFNRDEAEEQLKNMNPQHRFIEPIEIATTVAWLCRPGSESVNGQAITLDGGGITA